MKVDIYIMIIAKTLEHRTIYVSANFSVFLRRIVLYPDPMAIVDRFEAQKHSVSVRQRVHYLMLVCGIRFEYCGGQSWNTVMLSFLLSRLCTLWTRVIVKSFRYVLKSPWWSSYNVYFRVRITDVQWSSFSLIIHSRCPASFVLRNYIYVFGRQSGNRLSSSHHGLRNVIFIVVFLHYTIYYQYS